MLNGLKILLEIVIVALIYYITAKLALLLAIPPGYATAIWPAAGIALAAVIIGGLPASPGILLGSFFANLTLPLDFSHLSLQAIVLPFCIAIGAMLQATVGAFLVKPYVKNKILFIKLADITQFVFLGGPIACLINATISVSSLLMFGIINQNEYFFNWATWWVGDTIGVFIFTPIILLWAFNTKNFFERRRLTITFITSATFIFIVLLFIYASHWEQKQIETTFHRITDNLNRLIKDNIALYLNSFYLFQNFYISSPQPISQKSFKLFTLNVIKNTPGIQALSWVPYVEDHHRLQFESLAKKTIHSNFQITEQNKNREIVRASHRKQYFPVYYIEPIQGNEKAVGYDIASEFTRFRALEKARLSGKLSITAPLTLVQENEQQVGFLAVLPVYQDQSYLSNQEGMKNHAIKGFVTGVFRISYLFNTILKEVKNEYKDIFIQVNDISDSNKKILLYHFNASNKNLESNPILKKDSTLQVGGRSWLIQYSLNQQYLINHRQWTAWSFLAIGLLLTGLLQLFLLTLTGRTIEIEELVFQKTKELENTNKKLKFHLNEREKIAKMKDEFISIASHELRTPLTSIHGSLALLIAGVSGELPAQSQQLLMIAKQNSERLIRLINDILDIEKIESGQMEFQFQQIEIAHLLKEAITVNQFYGENINVKLKLLEPMQHLMVYVDHDRILQVLSNLISNAIKFSPQNGEITIAAIQQGNQVRVSVEDKGPGIPKKFQDKIFQKFAQADSSSSRKHGGTGLGLNISKVIIERHGGNISFTSKKNEGTIFYFDLPIFTSQ